MKIKKGINNILKIFKKDFKSAISHPIVILTLIAIIMIPSLYALVNIKACWDPYGNTGNLDFAIATGDNGAVLDGKVINIGNEVQDELKNNTDFSWKFVTIQQAEEGVKSGKYIAAIIFPRDFSKNFTSLNSSHPHNATIRYLVNDKNPLSSRMSNAASIQIHNKLNSKIVEIMGVSAVKKLNELQSALRSGADKLSAGAEQVNSGAAQVSSGIGQVDSGVSQVNGGISQVYSGKNKVKSGASVISSSSSKVTDGANQVMEGSRKVDEGVSELHKHPIPYAIVDVIAGELINGSSKVADASGKVAKGSSKLADGSVQLADGSVQLADGSVRLADGSVQLADGSKRLADGSLQLADGSTKLANSAAKGFNTAADSLDTITDINQGFFADFMNTPVKMNKEELFPVKNYGSEVAPFYLALSIWVGCIITTVMLSMGYNDGSVFSPLEYYFGKQLLFICMSICQATVTIIGSLILGFQIENIPLFIISMYIISVIFMFIIYSFISVFGQIGKAIMLVVLVLQISATGGVYPVGVMDSFIQFVNPLLPMTHAIIMLKEACIGLIVENYIYALLNLLVFPIIVFICSVLIKEKLNKSASYFEEVLEKSGIF